MSTEKPTTQNNSVKPIQLTEHGNFLYGTLDGIDFTASGIMQDTKRPYGVKILIEI